MSPIFIAILIFGFIVAAGAISEWFIFVVTGIKKRRAKERADRVIRYEELVMENIEKFKELSAQGATWDINREEEYYQRLFKRWKV